MPFPRLDRRTFLRAQATTLLLDRTAIFYASNLGNSSSSFGASTGVVSEV